MTAVVARSVAKEAGLKRYFTGEPCLKGHVAERFVQGSCCVECRRLQSQQWYSDKERSRKKAARWRAENPERDAANARKWRSANRDKTNRASRAWVERNPEKAKQRGRDWYWRNAEAQRQRSLEWRRANKERVAVTEKKWREENKEYLSAKAAAWRAAHPDNIRITAHNRRARKRAAGGKFTPEDVERIAEAQGHKCAYCKVKLTKKTRRIDHIIALFRGGTNDKTNIQITCDPCNSKKRFKHPVDFAREIGLLI